MFHKPSQLTHYCSACNFNVPSEAEFIADTTTVSIANTQLEDLTKYIQASYLCSTCKEALNLRFAYVKDLREALLMKEEMF